MTALAFHAPTDPAARVIDALDREWALTTSGTWACLGHGLTVDSFDQLHENYVVAAVTA
jgi:hypothetical protein